MDRRRRLNSLARLFRDSENHDNPGLPIRVTARGLWVPMPFAVLVALLRAMRTAGVFASPEHGRSTVVDAGTGDGRALAVLAHLEPTLSVVGIESDARLFHVAGANLETLAHKALVTSPERLRMLHGDYRQRATYAAAGIRLDEVGFILNYPDGNQDALERFVIETIAPGVKLCLLTHDRDLRLAKLARVSQQPVNVADPTSGWNWSVYSS